MKVSLYIEVSCKRIKAGKACFCYVLEYISPSGTTYTRSEIGCMESTGKRLILVALIRALKRLKQSCQVEIYTDMRYLESALSLGWLNKWKSAGWTGSDGKEIKNRDMWEEIEPLTRTHNLQVIHMSKSSYTTWMQNEMKKADLMPGEYKEISAN